MRGKRMAALVQKRKRRRKSRKAEKPARSWRSDRRTHQSRRPSRRSSEKGGGWKGGGEGGGSRGGDPKARTASREEDGLGGGRESAMRTEEEHASSGKAGPEAVTACTSLKSVSAIGLRTGGGGKPDRRRRGRRTFGLSVEIHALRAELLVHGAASAGVERGERSQSSEPALSSTQ